MTHILGGQVTEWCLHASTEAIKDAKAVAERKTKQPLAITTTDLIMSQPKSPGLPNGKWQFLPPALNQTSILPHGFKGVHMPFNDADQNAIQEQALCVVVDANLAFGIWENVEMIKLIYML